MTMWRTSGRQSVPAGRSGNGSGLCARRAWRPDTTASICDRSTVDLEHASHGGDEVLHDLLGPRALLPAAGLDADAAVQVLVEVGVERAHEIGIEGDEVDLLVPRDRSGVEVRRSDVGKEAVDGHHLGVEHGRLEVPDLDAMLEERLIVGL